MGQITGVGTVQINGGRDFTFSTLQMYLMRAIEIREEIRVLLCSCRRKYLKQEILHKTNSPTFLTLLNNTVISFIA